MIRRAREREAHMCALSHMSCRAATRTERVRSVLNVSVRGARSESCMVLFVLQFM